MHVAVTGATGFVGRAVVETLLARGHAVRLLARTRPRTEPEGNARFMPCDVADPDSLREAFASVDAIVHLVGIIVESGRATFERIHDEGTRNVLGAAEACGVGRLVHMSALGARADAPSRYHRTKWRAEEAVRNGGLNWTIFRPSIVYGRGDAFLNLFARMARFLPALPVVGGGRNKLQPIWVADVAHCFAAALQTPAGVGRSYDLGGPRAYTLRRLMEMVVRSRCRLPRLLVPLPLPLARIQARAMERLLRKPPLTREQLILLQEDNVCDPAPAQLDFDRSFRTLEAYLVLPPSAG